MDALLVRLQRTLNGRYAVEHELGRGGMAVVYLGQDLRLERRVAIKIFEKEGGLISAGERFLREIRVAAKLQHPNILPVHESGEGEGLVYYVMPYVAGASLRDRLEREGPLPVGDAVRIAREVAEALDHAHRAGIVHRDIKPDNIMLADGVAVVADFGIARAIEQSAGKVTDTGLAIGTPTYMSPEQAAASPLVDGRTDIYALGCVLYEMLAGTPPFSGTTAQMVMARHATDPAPPLSTVRNVPPALEAAITKALAKLPGDRWPTGKAFAERLTSAVTTVTTAQTVSPRGRAMRWMAMAAVPVIFAAVALLWPGSEPKAAAAEEARSVAVLPVTITGDTALTWKNLADGVTEGVSTGLVQVEGLGVLSGGSMQAYRDRAADPQSVGRDVRAGAVFSASLQGSGNRFRVTAKLTDVASGRLLWQQQFNGELVVNGQLQDNFAIQDSITAQVVDALRPRLDPAIRATLSRGVRTRNPEAYGLYLEARRTSSQALPASYERAIALLQQAVRLDSTFADAWVALADVTYSHSMVTGQPLVEVATKWLEPLERGIAFDRRNGWALAQRGWWRGYHDWNWEGARRDLQQAVRLAPGSADVASLYSKVLRMLDQDSAISQARRAVELEPANSLLWSFLGAELYLAGMRDSALAASDRALALDSTHWNTYHTRMHLYHDAGRSADADSAVARFLQLGGDSWSLSFGFAAVYYRRSGNRAAAREILARLEAMARRQHVPGSDLAPALLAVGDRAGALAVVEQAARDRDLLLPHAVRFELGPLAGEPRFEAVYRRIFRDAPRPRDPFP